MHQDIIADAQASIERLSQHIAFIVNQEAAKGRGVFAYAYYGTGPDVPKDWLVQEWDGLGPDSRSCLLTGHRSVRGEMFVCLLDDEFAPRLPDPAPFGVERHNMSCPHVGLLSVFALPCPSASTPPSPPRPSPGTASASR